MPLAEYQCTWTLIRSEGSSAWNGGSQSLSASQRKCSFHSSTIHLVSMCMFPKDLNGLLTRICLCCMLVMMQSVIRRLSMSLFYPNIDLTVSYTCISGLPSTHKFTNSLQKQTKFGRVRNIFCVSVNFAWNSLQNLNRLHSCQQSSCIDAYASTECPEIMYWHISM